MKKFLRKIIICISFLYSDYELSAVQSILSKLNFTDIDESKQPDFDNLLKFLGINYSDHSTSLSDRHNKFSSEDFYSEYFQDNPSLLSKKKNGPQSKQIIISFDIEGLMKDLVDDINEKLPEDLDKIDDELLIDFWHSLQDAKQKTNTVKTIAEVHKIIKDKEKEIEKIIEKAMFRKKGKKLIQCHIPKKYMKVSICIIKQ